MFFKPRCTLKPLCFVCTVSTPFTAHILSFVLIRTWRKSVYILGSCYITSTDSARHEGWEINSLRVITFLVLTTFGSLISALSSHFRLFLKDFVLKIDFLLITPSRHSNSLHSRQVTCANSSFRLLCFINSLVDIFLGLHRSFFY